MRRIPHLVAVLLRDWWRNREAVFFAFLFPLILLVIFSTVFGGGGAAEFTLYVQNNDVGADGEPTEVSAALVGALNDTDPLTVRRIDPDRDLDEWSRTADTSGQKRVLTIPDGFAARVRDGSRRVRAAVIRDTIDRFGNGSTGPGGENGSVGPGDGNGSAGGGSNAPGGPGSDAGPNGTGVERGLARLSNGTNATGPVAVTFLASPDDESAPAVRGIVASVVAGFNDRAIGVDEPAVTVGSDRLGTRELTGVDYYLPALIATVVVINGLITVTTVVSGFREDGTLKRLAATPLREREWILANVVQQSLLALAITGVMVLVAALVFGVTAVPGPLAVALLLLGAVGFSALGIALGGLVDGSDAATSLGNAIALPLMFLSGVFWEVELMPEYLQTAATLSPLYHFHRGLRRLVILDTAEGVATPFAVLGALAVVSVLLAVRLTRWEDFGD